MSECPGFSPDIDCTSVMCNDFVLICLCYLITKAMISFVADLVAWLAGDALAADTMIAYDAQLSARAASCGCQKKYFG